MADQQVQPAAQPDERLLSQPRKRVADEASPQGAPDQPILGAGQVEVVLVHESWWPTRQRQGVHVLNMTDTQLEMAKWVAARAGTNTVYHYKKF